MINDDRCGQKFARRDGKKVIELVMTAWQWANLTKLAAAHDVDFTLAGERIALPKEVIADIRDLVHYFAGGGV